MKKIAIVILNFNGSTDTLECLESVERLYQKGIDIKTIVVDNASTSEHLSILKAQKHKIELIENQENVGFSGGNNIGIHYALDWDPDYVLILNNDTILHKNLLWELFKIAESDKKIGIVVPKIYFAKGYEFHKNRYSEKELGKIIWYAGGIMDWKNVMGYHRGVDEVDGRQFDVLSSTDFASGCCMFVKREVFQRVGTFDEKYFLYYEDNDLSERVKRDGFHIIFNPKAMLWHKNAKSAGGSGSDLQDYYISRNRLLFGYRYAPLNSKAALFKESINLLFHGRKWQKRGVIDYYLGKFGKGSFFS